MKRFVRQLIMILGIFLAILVSGNVLGQTWQETTTIIPGQEYLIGFVNGNNVYLAVSYAPNESSHYYTSDNNTNWRGYTALAIFSGNNIVGVSGYADDLQYCTWIFNGDVQNGYTIQSVYNENYYLRTWSSLSYDDLYPDNTTSNATSWKYQNGTLYRTIDNTDRYAQYYYLDNTNIGPHMSVTSNQLTNNVRLYTNPNVCHKPTNLQVSNITTNSAHITWESENTNFQWSSNNSTWNNITGTSIDLLNLNAETEYTFYIKSICGENVESNTSQISFTTLKPREQCQVGDNWGTSTITYLPLNTLWNYSLTQQIYTPEEIGNSDYIASISFYSIYNSNFDAENVNVKIYFNLTDKESFDSNTDWLNISSNDLVFEGDVDFRNGGWVDLELNNPFWYDNSKNLCITVDAGLTWDSQLSFRTFEGNSNCSMYIYNDGTDYNAIGAIYSANSRVSVKNQIKLCTEEGWTLPITLRYFNATPRSDGKNLLKWVTAYESQNSNFEICRTRDILSNQWEPVVTLWQGMVDKPYGASYQWLDENPYDTTYYILVQNDLDGGFETFRSEYVVCIQSNLKSKRIEPYVTVDNAINIINADVLCDVYVYYANGGLRVQKRMYPNETKRLDIRGFYMVEFIWVEDGDIQRKVEKVVNY